MTTTVAGNVSECLRLQVGTNGHVWFGDGRRVAVDSELGIGPFVDQHKDMIRGASLIRMLGSGDNAALIGALETWTWRSGRYHTELPRLQLTSPAPCAHDGPREVLTYLWHAGTSTDTLCNWASVDQVDVVCYRLVAAVRAGDMQAAARLLLYHPAWVAMSFIPGRRVDDCCRLLAEIVDARWFRHPDRPGRATRLFEYLGLSPTTVKGLVKGIAPNLGNDAYRARAGLAVSAWTGVMPYLACRTVETTPAETVAGGFLRQAYAKASTKARGLQHATRLYVRYVREVWEAERHLWVSGVTSEFIPDGFLCDPVENLAYQEHRRNLRKEAGFEPG